MVITIPPPRICWSGKKLLRGYAVVIYHPSPLEYVSKERTGYAATQWSFITLFAKVRTPFCLNQGMATEARPSRVIDIRELTQQDDWKTQDGKMSRKIGNAQSRATFFRHSAVLLRKLPNTASGWLVRKYGLRPPTPPYLREGLACWNRFVPPASPSSCSDLSDHETAAHLDDLLLCASPTPLLTLASDVVPPPPEPVRRSGRLAPRRTLPVDKMVADSAASVLRWTRTSRA